MMEGSSTNVNITLPYAAFDLTASAPLVNSTTRYYPLKRAANSTQYLLGRTFLQEAFLIADYERRNFSVSPCQWDTISKPDIITTFSPTYNMTSVAGSPPPPSNNSTTKVSGGSSDIGAIAGGVVGGVLVSVIIAGLVFFFCYWKPKRRQDYSTHGEKSEMFAHLPDNPALALGDRHLSKAELGNTQRTSGVPELEGSSGAVFEMPVREEAASEMSAPYNNVYEMPTPETASEVTRDGFPWRMSLLERRAGQSPSPLGSPEAQSVTSPVSSPSLRFSSPIPSPSMIPSPLPSPPQRAVRPDLNSVGPSYN